MDNRYPIMVNPWLVWHIISRRQGANYFGKKIRILLRRSRIGHFPPHKNAIHVNKCFEMNGIIWFIAGHPLCGECRSECDIALEYQCIWFIHWHGNSTFILNMHIFLSTTRFCLSGIFLHLARSFVLGDDKTLKYRECAACVLYFSVTVNGLKGELTS
jgi:hypothetical protein